MMMFDRRGGVGQSHVVGGMTTVAPVFLGPYSCNIACRGHGAHGNRLQTSHHQTPKFPLRDIARIIHFLQFDNASPSGDDTRELEKLCRYYTDFLEKVTQRLSHSHGVFPVRGTKSRLSYP